MPLDRLKRLNTKFIDKSINQGRNHWGSGGPDPPKFGRTTPTFWRRVWLPLRNRLQCTKLGIPSVFCSVQ